MLAGLAKGARTQMSDPTHNSDGMPEASTESTPAATDPNQNANPAEDSAPTADSASDAPVSAEIPAAEPADAAPAASAYTGPTAPLPDAYGAPTPTPTPETDATAEHPTAPVPGAAPVPPGSSAPTAPAAPPAPSLGLPGTPAPNVATAPGTTGAPTATKEKKRSIAVPVVIALVAGAVVGGGSAAGVSALIDHGSSNQQQTSSGTPQTITVNNSGDVNAVTAIAKKASPSVVTINVTAGQEAGTGSGVILSSDGYILTNTHVVTLDGASGSGTVEVTTYDGKLYKAKVVGTDPIVDLAVIKLQNASGLTPIEFGDSSNLNVGDRVVAIGAPLGLSNTVTDGIVSALNRSIQIQSSAAPDSSSSGGDTSSPNDNGGNGPFNFWNFGNGNGSSGNGSSSQTNEISLPVIQTDAAINPGNSGGALVDDSGKLVGINVAIASTGSTSSTDSQSGSIGVGFAIPADLAQRIAKEIEATGKGTHGLLGASVTDATSDNSSTVGALIDSVTSGGAAASAGLQKGDVVTQVNGIPITDSTDLTAQVRSFAPGTKVQITYIRDGAAKTTDAALGTLSS